MDAHRCFIALAVIVLMTCPMAYASATPDEEVPFVPGEHPLVRPMEASSLWIVVNLFTGRTSEQAVRVRDTFAKLGARGHGIVLPYRDITVENMIKLRPAFLALSPNGIPWCRYRGKNGEDLRNFLHALKIIVEQMNIPVIGICGGHQALALAFGGKVGPILGGEDDCFPYRKNPTERGRHNLQVVRNDPLFIGMGPTLNLVQNHYDEVKRLPPGFLCLAKNKLCPYQIMRHPSRPVYGVQAHTEYYLKSRPDGGVLLRNFLHIAATHNRIARAPKFLKEPRTVLGLSTGFPKGGVEVSVNLPDLVAPASVPVW
ncbi:MAG: gamma-glutamyl-gamma-aminobutyrate hydrolase family protein [Desulfomonilaceae bacterium]|nr:gamma-glutamyl-gamma-aminobutyrate hydrolase family protein [Desulfomonilaceae bacterium]